MSIDPTPEFPTAPPTSPFVMAPRPPQSTWPLVIGIIAIVFGGLGLLGAAWSVSVYLFMPQMMKAGINASPEMDSTLARYTPYLLAIELVMTMLPVSILAGGIRLVLVGCRVGCSDSLVGDTEDSRRAGASPSPTACTDPAVQSHAAAVQCAPLPERV